MIFIRLASEYVAPSISDFFNFCLEQLTYPDNLRNAKATPIHKKNLKITDRSQFCVTLVNFSKIFYLIV